MLLVDAIGWLLGSAHTGGAVERSWASHRAHYHMHTLQTQGQYCTLDVLMIARVGLQHQH